MAGETKISVKFFVDKEKRRVVHAEAGKDFVDILFSFLTLPLGAIVKVLKKQSSLGSMDNLYDSVEKLDIEHLQTEACKTMLLNPRSEAAVQCEDLKINVDDINPRQVYFCKEDDCCSKETCLGSSVANARCIHCKGEMNLVKFWPKGDERLFVEGAKYIISNDLLVEPASAIHIISMMKNMNIKDYKVLEEVAYSFGINEIIELLKRLLVSRMPLTDYYYQNDMTVTLVSQNLRRKEMVQVKTETTAEIDTEGMNIKLLLDKADNKVLFVEAGEDFIDQLFSFLTMPLSCLIKILNKNSGIGCVDNLYASVEKLSLEYIVFEECRSMLLSPKLAPFFTLSNNMLNLDEIKPEESTGPGCYTCFWNNGNKNCTSAKCDHGVEKSVLNELNPKSSDGGTEIGGGYAKVGPGNFMVSDDLHVRPLSTSSIIQILDTLEVAICNVVERELKVGEAQVLDLLRAAMSSKTPLSDVFSSQYLRNRPLCPLD